MPSKKEHASSGDSADSMAALHLRSISCRPEVEGDVASVSRATDDDTDDAVNGRKVLDEDEGWIVLPSTSTMSRPDPTADAMEGVNQSVSDAVQSANESDPEEDFSNLAVAELLLADNYAEPPTQEMLRPRSKRATYHNGLKCKLCSEEIRGARWICKQCPRWNMCDDCISTVNLKDIHPNHSFLCIASSSDIYPRDSLYPFGLSPSLLDTLPTYSEGEGIGAICNACHQIIVGPRYECAVLQCRGSRVTFCEDCEALPIPCHPNTHPLIKYKMAKFQCIPVNYPRTVVVNETNNMTGEDVAECLLSKNSRSRSNGIPA